MKGDSLWSHPFVGIDNFDPYILDILKERTFGMFTPTNPLLTVIPVRFKFIQIISIYIPIIAPFISIYVDEIAILWCQITIKNCWLNPHLWWLHSFKCGGNVRFFFFFRTGFWGFHSWAELFSQASNQMLRAKLHWGQSQRVSGKGFHKC